MAAKYPACGRAGLANNPSPRGAFNHTGFRQPMARPCRGRGGPGIPPPPLTPGAAERRPSPAPGPSPAATHLHSGFGQIEPHGQLLPGGDTHAAVSPGHRPPPRAAPQPAALRAPAAKRARNPGARGRRGAGPGGGRTPLAAALSPAAGRRAGRPSGLPSFGKPHPPPPLPSFRPVPAATAAQGGGAAAEPPHAAVSIATIKANRKPLRP